ncbi:hypothetical protein EVAR_21369_1 [Eumeta japonica]|uniref:Uncharacterized protein n=1 Tax=Eumeta variegata TaxID=151549 RepID=A0A4C1YDI7_EUMVA|nr:hypothetical protein EVAR_21369_1 [Eumeta japonica]
MDISRSNGFVADESAMALYISASSKPETYTLKTLPRFSCIASHESQTIQFVWIQTRLTSLRTVKVRPSHRKGRKRARAPPAADRTRYGNTLYSDIFGCIDSHEEDAGAGARINRRRSRTGRGLCAGAAPARAVL